MKDSKPNFDLVIQTYQKIPGSKGIRYEFDLENNLEFKADVRFNNWGYRSDFDWSNEKSQDEFRIAIFGDSYTECETNDFTWVDVLHKKLSAKPELLKRLGRESITVANFGRSGSGFQSFALEYLRVRESFKPDLTIFAFIDEDFERLIHPLRGLGNTPPSPAKKFRPDSRFTDIQNYLQIPGFGGQLYAVRSGRMAFVRSLYYAGNDHSLILDKESLRTVKYFLAETVARDKYLKTWGCELCKLAASTVQSIFPQLMPSVAEGSNPVDVFLRAAYESIDVVGPEPLILINLPTFYETVNQHSKEGPLRTPKYFPQAALQNSSLKIIPLADFLPKSANYEEKYSWFTLPWDGHPSNRGAALFGETLSVLLADYLVGSNTGGSSRPYMLLTGTRAQELMLAAGETREREVKEARAYQVLEVARKMRGEKRYSESLELFSEVLKLAPHIGMPGLIYVERGDIYQNLGQLQDALNDYTQAILINPDRSFLIRHASVAYALGKADLVETDVAKLKACCKNDAEVNKFLIQIISANKQK